MLRTLNVMVLPPRAVSVGIYRVIDNQSPRTFPLTGAPSDNQILKELNDDFEQAGVRFVNANSTEVAPILIRYDVSGSIQGARPNDGLVQGSERDAIYKKLKDEGRPGQIYLMLTKNSGIEGTTKRGSFVRGQTVPNSKPADCMVFVQTCSDRRTDVSMAAAHEIGHALDLKEDPEAYPQSTLKLMDPGGKDANGNWKQPGHWLRHEDWKKANLGAYEIIHNPITTP